MGIGHIYFEKLFFQKQGRGYLEKWETFQQIGLKDFLQYLQWYRTPFFFFPAPEKRIL